MNFLQSLLTDDIESRKLMQFVRRAQERAGKPLSILDVGCGYGRLLKRLRAEGFSATGVEVNEAIVAENRKAGLACVSAAEFSAGPAKTYDLIIMSHVIEHFAPHDLLKFIDTYLDALRPGGTLLVATPLMSPYFYDDFDHVRPYQPTGLLMVFGRSVAQVQYQARNKLELEDVWFRRSHFQFRYLRACYRPSLGRKLLFLCEVASNLTFRLSLGLIGRTDGWIGAFTKL